MEDLKKEFEELKFESAKLENEIEGLKNDIKSKDRDISQLRKDYNEIFEALRQLRNEKKILLEKLNNEIKVRHLNPYSKPHKPQIIKGDNFLFIG